MLLACVVPLRRGTARGLGCWPLGAVRLLLIWKIWAAVRCYKLAYLDQ